MDNEFLNISNQLILAGHYMHNKGWVPATSGNFSAKLSDNTIAITTSGVHKGKLSLNDIMLLDSDGNPLTNKRPSAEALLHVQIYKTFPDMKCVLHPHSIYATILSKFSGKDIKLQDYELLKAFPGIKTHECSINVPVFKNDQDIKSLSIYVQEYLKSGPVIFGYLIEGHGFYTWSNSIDNCIKQVEAFEFLFQCEIIKASLMTH